MNTYRDDLDAVLQRAAELDRQNETLRARNAELEHRLAPAPAVTEEEANRARLAEALRREREEATAREQAAREEAQLRAYLKANALASVDQRREARSLVLTFAFIGSITAGALGSVGGIGVVAAVASVILTIVDPRRLPHE